MEREVVAPRLVGKNLSRNFPPSSFTKGSHTYICGGIQVGRPVSSVSGVSQTMRRDKDKERVLIAPRGVSVR